MSPGPTVNHANGVRDGMGMLAATGRALSKWYIAVPLLTALGVVIGAVIFFNVFPGRPQIGVITIPYTVINEDSAYVITSYLDYANRNDRIKAVVVRLSSPGGGATSSERLYIESRNLRENKPLVMVMNDLVASGGFIMAMGASTSGRLRNASSFWTAFSPGWKAGVKMDNLSRQSRQETK